VQHLLDAKVGGSLPVTSGFYVAFAGRTSAGLKCPDRRELQYITGIVAFPVERDAIDVSAIGG
jgi:hypothetical protein